MKLTLVRHGETEGQSSVRYHGRNDVPLSALGRAQMARARAALAHERFDGVYASTLSRSVEAAAIIAGERATVTRVAGFDEINFGEWEGLTAEEIRRRDPQRYAEWVGTRTDFHYPGGESVASFRARVVGALHEVLAQALAQAPAGHLLFAVHKGIISSMLMDLLRLDEARRRALRVPLASIHVVARANGGWQAEVLDRTDHL